MNDNERRQLETEVMKAGLAGLVGLKDGVADFIQVIARIVNNWQTSPNRQGEWIDQHKFLRDLFAECDEADRAAMYSAIVPRLTFKALPLSTYESMITERVDRLVSKGAARVEGQEPKPIEVGGKKYAKASADQATNAIATLHCQRCWKKKRFLGDTPVGALIAARNAGWARMPDKWTCPICAKKLLTEKKAFVN